MDAIALESMLIKKAKWIYLTTVYCVLLFILFQLFSIKRSKVHAEFGGL